LIIAIGFDEEGVCRTDIFADDPNFDIAPAIRSEIDFRPICGDCGCRCGEINALDILVRRACDESQDRLAEEVMIPHDECSIVPSDCEE
jgi:hypothetical protein